MSTTIREFGSEFDWAANEPFVTTEHKPALLQTPVYYRSGRDALKEIARTNSPRYRRVLLPALCCESMVSPFTMNGYEAVFYRLRADFTADADDIREKITDDTVLLYIRYFGIVPLTDEELLSLTAVAPHARLVEDRTHDLPIRRTEKAAVTPHYTMASIRKWLAIGDGGVLSTDFEVGRCEAEPQFAALRRTAMEQKSVFLATGDEAIKTQFRAGLAEASELLDVDPVPYAMTEASKVLLESIDFDAIAQKRQANARALKALLTPLEKKGKLTFITDRPENSTLYFPILVDDQGAVQQAAAKRGVFCPVIWPVPAEAKGVCPVAEMAADRMLGVPCDQRYSEEDMAYIADVLTAAIGEG